MNPPSPAAGPSHGRTRVATAGKSPLQVAFLTGQSRPPSTALSPAQTAFLAGMPVPAAWRCARNFPYESREEDRHRPSPLLLASMHNGLQYWRSRRRGFATRYRPGVGTLLAAADHTLFLAGSCGLELFNNLELSPENLARVSVFAYGPVARRRPGCVCFLVQGHRDRLSRRYFPAVDARVDVGHLGYLEDATVLTLAAAMVRRLLPTPVTLSAR